MTSVDAFAIVTINLPAIRTTKLLKQPSPPSSEDAARIDQLFVKTEKRWRRPSILDGPKLTLNDVEWGDTQDGKTFVVLCDAWDDRQGTNITESLATVTTERQALLICARKNYDAAIDLGAKMDVFNSRAVVLMSNWELAQYASALVAELELFPYGRSYDYCLADAAATTESMQDVVEEVVTRRWILEMLQREDAASRENAA